ncbi:hypothetical protein CASFOL_020155 [Castilleja foliolosa]|uniref:Histone H2A n=1 Tax=Castilleja foliolosa TaxID=1961234 RepID=A0ABD3D017_9LAMI
MNITRFSGLKPGTETELLPEDFSRLRAQNVGEGSVKIRLYEGRVAQGPLRGTPVIFKVYPGQRVGGLEAVLMRIGVGGSVNGWSGLGNVAEALLWPGKKISPWHDIPPHLGDGVFNFIVEIPKESSAKMEVATDELFTPIKQDTKKGKLRYYPYGGRRVERHGGGRRLRLETVIGRLRRLSGATKFSDYGRLCPSMSICSFGSQLVFEEGALCSAVRIRCPVVVLEYLAASFSVLELIRNATSDNKKIKIIPKQLLLAVRNDEITVIRQLKLLGLKFD